MQYYSVCMCVCVRSNDAVLVMTETSQVGVRSQTGEDLFQVLQVYC